jgi:arginine-tRNA-protein transferase
MIDDILFPEHLTGKQLDDYLGRGWFRMGQTIFTSDSVLLEGIIYPVHWLRINLQKLKYGKSQRKLFVVNKNFSVQIKPLGISTELEDLFTLYRRSVDFNPPESVAEWLFLGIERNIYDSQIIEVRDDGKLIAAGIFDMGDKSIAGILNFYHPLYKKNSLGKYLMLLKINHAIKLGKTWYYPGYIASGYSKFNYKLFADKRATELYDKENEEWIPFLSSSLTSITRIGRQDEPLEN